MGMSHDDSRRPVDTRGCWCCSVCPAVGTLPCQGALPPAPWGVWGVCVLRPGRGRTANGSAEAAERGG